uniref:Dickkopf_N domain-containing protein n=1 Tax=Steinernema glaseri TaxID=37863 RepID=A0A1I7Z122_9BILA
MLFTKKMLYVWMNTKAGTPFCVLSFVHKTAYINGRSPSVSQSVIDRRLSCCASSSSSPCSPWSSPKLRLAVPKAKNGTPVAVVNPTATIRSQCVPRSATQEDVFANMDSSASTDCQWENNPCALAECVTGRVCVIEPVICKKAPCPKKPVCIERHCFN